jgi:hypothetical protein
MASMKVRLLRVAIGASMVVWGFTETTSVGYVVGTIGVLPMLGGLYDFCILAPLFGGPIAGQAALHSRYLP